MAATPKNIDPNVTRAKRIISLLGGAHFISLTGAHKLSVLDTGLRFRLPNLIALRQINRVEVLREPGEAEIYTLRFLRREKPAGAGSGTDYPVCDIEHVGADGLATMFTKATGLATDVL